MHICFQWEHPRSRRCGSTLHNAGRRNTPTCRSECLKAVCRVWTFIDTYFNPAMRNKATRRRRSIPQALDRDTQTWHHGIFADSPLARWTVAIPQAPRSRHQSYHGTSKPAIPHVDAGFRKHQLESQVALQSQHIKSSHSPCRRSIPQALVRDTHTWHHCVLPEYPLACLMDAIPQAPVRDTPVASRHIKTSHSQCRRWISQAPTRVKSGITIATYQKQQFPCRHSIPQALVRDTHTWHHCV